MIIPVINSYQEAGKVLINAVNGYRRSGTIVDCQATWISLMLSCSCTQHKVPRSAITSDVNLRVLVSIVP